MNQDSLWFNTIWRALEQLPLRFTDLLGTADVLLKSNGGAPTDATLRRAQSTIYYAYFHALAECCSDMLIGAFNDPTTSKPAWLQTYRALEHGIANKRCSNNDVLQKFAPEISAFATAFTSLQIKRHTADYNPYPSQPVSAYDVTVDYTSAAKIITDFLNSSIKDKTAFCAYVLINIRKE
jgi:hypothetical protein